MVHLENNNNVRSILMGRELEMILDALLHEIERYNKALDLITDDHARHALSKAKERYYNVHQRLCELLEDREAEAPQTSEQVPAKASEENGTFRFDLWGTPTKQIEAPRCGMLWSGTTRERVESVALGIVIGLKEKYQNPHVMLYQLNNDGSEKLIREQR